MATPLEQYRETHPIYDDISDQVLADALYEKKGYADQNSPLYLPREEFDIRFGLNATPVVGDMAPKSLATGGLAGGLISKLIAPGTVAQRQFRTGTAGLAQSGTELAAEFVRWSDRYHPRNYLDEEQIKSLRNNTTNEFLSAMTPEQKAKREEDMAADTDIQELIATSDQLATTMEERRIPEAKAEDLWTPKGIIGTAIESGTRMAPALAAGGLVSTGTRALFGVGSAAFKALQPAVMKAIQRVEAIPAILTSVGAIGADVRGTALREGREMGLSEEDSMNRAGLMMLAEMLPETFPVMAMLGKLPGVKSGIKTLMAGMFGEAGQEMVTEALQMGIDKGLYDENASFANAISAIFSLEGLEQVAFAGVIGGVMGGPLAAPAAIGASRKARQDKETEIRRNALQDIQDAPTVDDAIDAAKRALAETGIEIVIEGERDIDAETDFEERLHRQNVADAQNELETLLNKAPDGVDTNPLSPWGVRIEVQRNRLVELGVEPSLPEVSAEPLPDVAETPQVEPEQAVALAAEPAVSEVTQKAREDMEKAGGVINNDILFREQAIRENLGDESATEYVAETERIQAESLAARQPAAEPETVPLDQIRIDEDFLTEEGETVQVSRKADVVISEIDSRIDATKVLIGCLRR